MGAKPPSKIARGAQPLPQSSTPVSKKCFSFTGANLPKQFGSFARSKDLPLR